MPGVVLGALDKHSLQPCNMEAYLCSHHCLLPGLCPSCPTGLSDSTALLACRSHPTPAYGHHEKGRSCSQSEFWPLSKQNGCREGAQLLSVFWFRRGPGSELAWPGSPQPGRKESASWLALSAHGESDGSDHQRKLTFGSPLTLGSGVIWLSHQMYLGTCSLLRSHDSLNYSKSYLC